MFGKSIQFCDNIMEFSSIKRLKNSIAKKADVIFPPINQDNQDDQIDLITHVYQNEANCVHCDCYLQILHVRSRPFPSNFFSALHYRMAENNPTCLSLYYYKSDCTGESESNWDGVLKK